MEFKVPNFLKLPAKEEKEAYGPSNWSRKDMPDFKGRKAYVLPGAMKFDVVLLMTAAGFAEAKSVEDADVVVFTGGSDVNAALYGETAIANSYYDHGRDAREKEIYRKCREQNKFMFGICRGAQFLWVMNGGKLVQHMDNHAGKSHFIIDIMTNERVKATSLHHQAILAPSAEDCYKHNHFEMLAVTEDEVCENIILRPEDGVLQWEDFPQGFVEVEAGYCRSSGCMLIQGHPEIGIPEYQSWSMWQVMDRLVEWEIKHKPLPPKENQAPEKQYVTTHHNSET